MRNNQEESLAWLLNLVGDFPANELQSQNMRAIKQDQLNQLKQSDEIQEALIYTYSIEKGEFKQQKFKLLPNILIELSKEKPTNQLMPPQTQFQHQLEADARYLILSNCTITQKHLSYKQNQAYGMILSNLQGSTFLFFTQFITYRSWYKMLKQYCKLTNFLEKYKLGDKILPGFYMCTKKKTKLQYTVQIYKIDDFEQCAELEEAVHNEIHILRSIKHQSLLELKRVYENPKYLFIVYEQYKGESLFNLISQGVILHEIQIASVLNDTIYRDKIIYQILQLVKFLNQHSFYHGCLNPSNILINTQNSMLQITVINLSFKVVGYINMIYQEYKVNDKLDWILNRAVESFLAPEIFEGVAPNVLTDLYSVGCLLYFITFFDEKQLESQEEKDFYQLMDDFKIDQSKIDEQESILTKRFAQKQQASQGISASQIDLLKKLLVTDPNKRFTIKEATKHHWFVNIKSKIKTMKVERKRKKPLPSLRTIIELREQSEMDIRMTVIQQQQSGLNIGSRLFLPIQTSKHMSSVPKQPSQMTQFLPQRTVFNPFDDEEDVADDEEDLNIEMRILIIDIWGKAYKKSQQSKSTRNKELYD